MSEIKDNLERVRERIATACLRAGRDPEEVHLVAVTKTMPVPVIQEAVAAGVTILGENRVQDAAAKMKEISADVTWHLIGHLQRNKVKKAVTMFDMIQSVDSSRLAAEIDKRCEQHGRVVDVLVEVNTSAEASKFGVSPSGALDLIEEMSHLRNIVVKGLMTIGTFTDDERAVRDCFVTLRELGRKAEDAGIPGVEMRFLSMGMTSDFEMAIEEGSNMVRIGTAIFGPRRT
jgi:pyridoxal phosphate enzyme (YggS family)